MQAYRLAFTEPMSFTPVIYREKPAMVPNTITKPSAANISPSARIPVTVHGWEIKVRAMPPIVPFPMQGSVGYHIFSEVLQVPVCKVLLLPAEASPISSARPESARVVGFPWVAMRKTPMIARMTPVTSCTVGILLVRKHTHTTISAGPRYWMTVAVPALDHSIV